MSKQMTHQQLRDKFAEFWQKQKHVEVPPIPLVPENDPTTLFTGSGMQQLVPYLAGEAHPLGKRLFNVQLSLRAHGIDDDSREVGDNRHFTVFEMMGNWSLGDYYKKEQLPWCWEFVTEYLKLSKDRLYVSCFEGNKDVEKDTESASIWKNLGVSEDHIFFYPASKNWWSRAGEPENMPAGEVGGPNSEIFYEFTDIAHNPKFGKECHPNCDCGRFLEIGNSVFMTYIKEEDGSLKELPNKNVDFGGGLERLLASANNVSDAFKTDLFYPTIQKIETLSKKKYGSNDQEKVAFQVLADHIRSAVMMIADGVIPSNTDRGYVARKLIRRAVRFSNQLDLDQGFTKPLALEAINTMKSAYPHLEKQKETIIKELLTEEEKFRKTLTRGIKEFEKVAKKQKKISGKDAFFLYETYGFPVEMTQELADEKSIPIDMKGFEEEKNRHKQASKKGLDKKFRGGLADNSEMTIKYHTATHLLHQALRDTLGNDVGQRGSNITAERLRFDFNYGQKMTDEQIKQVEIVVNEKIQEALPVTKRVTTYKKATEEGVISFFGQRYPEKINVYSIGEYSKEICGGPHVTNTKTLGQFKIQKEASAGAGIRRVYAILE